MRVQQRATRGLGDVWVPVGMTETDTPSAQASTAPLAVVTGASSGIGFELARQFVDHGFDVLLAAEDDELETAASTLRHDTEAQVRAVPTDLRSPQGVRDLYAAIRADGRPVAAIPSMPE
jgi:short-subunit dehydrogenase